MARKLKKTWEVWKMMAGLDIIIYRDHEVASISLQRRAYREKNDRKPYDP